MAKCTILGCNQEFVNREQAELHAATTWHCISCGYSDNTELTMENLANNCHDCSKSTRKCIRVDFKRKAYFVNGVLSVKEKGRWTHYE